MVQHNDSRAHQDEALYEFFGLLFAVSGVWMQKRHANRPDQSSPHQVEFLSVCCLNLPGRSNNSNRLRANSTAAAVKSTPV